MSEQMNGVVEGINGARGVFITAMPDCLLYDSWVADESWAAEEVATYFGDLVRANRQGLRSLGSWSSDMQVTIESADALVVLSELSEHFVCGCVFERSVPLGMVRLHLKRLHERLRALLPTITVEDRPRAVRIVDFLHRYAPDPHTVMMRVALRTQIEMDLLENPHRIEDADVPKLEDAAKRILGLEQLNV